MRDEHFERLVASYATAVDGLESYLAQPSCGDPAVRRVLLQQLEIVAWDRFRAAIGHLWSHRTRAGEA